MAVPCKTLEEVKVQSNAPIKLGKWNFYNVKYTKPFDYHTYSNILCIHDLDNSSSRKMTVGKFKENFSKELGSYVDGNLNISNLNFKDRYLPASFTPSQLKRILEEASKLHSDLVIYLVPEVNNVQNYKMFKQLCDQKYGLKTVCMKVEKVGNLHHQAQKPRDLDKKPWKGYVANVGMKINMKLGGTNHMVTDLIISKDDAPKLQNTMILGADVTHPSPGSVEGTPSVAAVVGSVDKDFTKFRGSMRRQAPRGAKQSEEMIQEMKRMVSERLQAYKKHNRGRYPDHIMYYRDGVSDSQYASVKRDELRAIREAYAEETKSDKETKSGKTVKITAIITAKRHHTRFYPSTGRPGNVLPGTVVDSTVTSPIWFDFFIVAHNGIKGTSRPTHYFVLENEMGFDANQLQNFTNKLCYTYVRSTSAVSYAPPAYYADRLCEHGRIYLKRFFDGTLNLADERRRIKDRWETDDEAFDRCLKEDWTCGQDRENPWHPNLDDVMFWM